MATPKNGFVQITFEDFEALRGEKSAAEEANARALQYEVVIHELQRVMQELNSRLDSAPAAVEQLERSRNAYRRLLARCSKLIDERDVFETELLELKKMVKRGAV